MGVIVERHYKGEFRTDTYLRSKRFDDDIKRKYVCKDCETIYKGSKAEHVCPVCGCRAVLSYAKYQWRNLE